MSTRFNLLCDEQGRISFCLVDGEGDVLLQGLPCRGKVAAQTEIMRTRKSLRAPDQLIPHESQAGEHFVVVKNNDGDVIARSRRVGTPGELAQLVEVIRSTGADAVIVDQTGVEAVRCNRSDGMRVFQAGLVESNCRIGGGFALPRSLCARRLAGPAPLLHEPERTPASPSRLEGGIGSERTEHARARSQLQLPVCLASGGE